MERQEMRELLWATDGGPVMMDEDSTAVEELRWWWGHSALLAKALKQLLDETEGS